MADKYCEGKHTAGPQFESGNVYCKVCGEFLWKWETPEEPDFRWNPKAPEGVGLESIQSGGLLPIDGVDD